MAAKKSDSDFSDQENDTKDNIVPQLPKIPEFNRDDELYAYYQNLGEGLNLRGQALLTYITDNVKAYKDDWRKARIDKQKLIEKQMEAESQEKKRKFQKKLDQAKRKHEKEMKELEITLQQKFALEQRRQRKYEKSQKEKDEALRREQRQYEESQRQQQREFEEKQRQEQRKFELELKEKQREHEESQKLAEMIEKQKQRDHEILMQEKELAAKQKQNEEEAAARVEKKESQQRKELPRMSHFKPEHDDIDAFINRFELMARQLNWQRDKWGLYLSNYLEGEALTLFNYLITDNEVDYEKLKRELLFKFKCDSEGFHERFRNGVPLPDESFHAYYTRLAGLYNRWLSLKNINKDYESLFDFMIVEQMLAGCCKELRVHLKERRLILSKDIIEEADSYREARSNRDVAKKGPITLAGNSQSTAAAGVVDTGVNQRGDRHMRGNLRGRGTGQLIKGRFQGQYQGNRDDKDKNVPSNDNKHEN